jgi:hypothetical protein
LPLGKQLSKNGPTGALRPDLKAIGKTRKHQRSTKRPQRGNVGILKSRPSDGRYRRCSRIKRLPGKGQEGNRSPRAGDREVIAKSFFDKANPQ